MNAPMNPATEIRLDNVQFSYGETAMHFEATIKGGVIAAIVGPSGSGKSTLLNLIAGFEFPQSGRILIGGNDVSEFSPADRPVSMVFQENNLFAHLSVEQNVGLGRSPNLKLSAKDRADIAEALSRVGLAGKEQRSPAANGSAWRLPARSYASALFYSLTKPLPRWAPRCGIKCWNWSGSFSLKPA